MLLSPEILGIGPLAGGAAADHVTGERRPCRDDGNINFDYHLSACL
jgi:hypothetical protein